jgi:tetratricopeptide (TPR) repeat protein
LYDLSPEDSNKISSNFKTALEALNKAKALDDKDSLNFVFIANLYKEFIPIQEGVGEKALENYRKAIELDPKNPDLYQSIAGVYVTLSDLAAQRQAQQQAQAGGQGKEPELPQKSKEYLSLAEENLQTAISIRPYHPGSNVMLVTVYQRYNQPDKAIEKAKENIQKFPNTPELYFNLGSIYYGRENYEEARDQLLEAVKLNDKYSNARYFLGLAYNKLGDNEKAIAQFEKVQEFNSDNEEVGKIIENLKNGNDPLEGLQAPQQSGQPEVDTPVPQEELPSNNEGVTPEIGEETPPVEQSGEELQPVDENPEPEEETISDEEGEEEDEENEEDAE